MSKWAHTLGVESDERSLVIHMTAVFAVIQSTHALGYNSADALFFLRFGVEHLPLMILLSGIAVMVSLLAHSAQLGRRGSRTWLPLVTAICGLISIGEWALTSVSSNAVYPVIWISTQAVAMLSLTVMWNAAAASSTTRQAKRLYPLYASAGVAGAVVGNLATGPLASAFGAETLLLIQGFMLGIGAAAMRRAARRHFRPTVQAGDSTRGEVASAYRTVRSSRLMRLTAAASFVLASLLYLVVFPFNEAVADSFSSEAEIAGFLGLFASLATTLTFLVSLLVTRRLFSRLGIVLSLMIAPLVYVLGFGTWLFSFTLVSAAVVRIAQWIAVNAIAGTATTALYNVLPGSRRGQVMSFMTAVPTQAGTIAGGAILMVASTFGHQVLFMTGLSLSVAATVLMFYMRPAYVEAVVGAVQRGLGTVLHAPHEGVVSPFGRESIDALNAHLRGTTPEERLAGVVGLSAVGDTGHLSAIEPLTRDADPRVRIAALDALCAGDPDSAPTFIKAGLADESPQVRRHVISSAGKRATDSELRTLLEDPDWRVRSAAARAVGGEEAQRTIDEMLATGDPEATLTVLTTAGEADNLKVDTKPHMTDRDPRVRAAAIRLGSRNDVDVDDLLVGLADPSPLVRRVTAESLAETPQGRTHLLGTLVSGSYSSTDLVLRALTPVDRFSDDFLSWAQREGERARFLATMRSAFDAETSNLYLETLSDVLEKRSRRISDWVILAMTTTSNSDLMTIVERGVSSDDPDTRSQAMEALDAIGDRPVAGPLLELLEARLPKTELDQHEALLALKDDFDPWIRALAQAGLGNRPTALDTPSMPESSAVSPISQNELSTLDRVLALRHASLFSELDPEDLELLAGAVQEVHFGGGEKIYRSGDTGTEMMIIIDGEAVVTSEHNGGTSEVARYVAGDHVGELALLQGSTRSADVTAGDAGLSGFVLADTDLRSILHERPGVAIAMLNTLAKRLVEQT